MERWWNGPVLGCLPMPTSRAHFVALVLLIVTAAHVSLPLGASGEGASPPSGASGEGATPPTTLEEAVEGDALAAYGLELYRQHYCGVCHHLTVADTHGVFGPTHDGMAAIAQERVSSDAYAGSAATADEYVRESIVDPEAFLVPGYTITPHRMPAYAHLTDAELEALVHFLMQQ